jgi:hypothetical protein
MHAPINDVQKIKNISEHRKIGGPNKFQLVAGNYGKKMNFLYPRILVDSQKLIRKFKEHYKNIEIYTENVCPQFDLIIKEGNVIEPKNLSKGAVKFLELVCG